MVQELRRSLGVSDAVVIGLGSMVGAGIFAALGPAARAAGPALLPALALAAVVAYCNASSSARLAVRHPASGGTYVYGREQLGPFWGYLAGWSFVVGKTASCAAMALTVGAYLWPGRAHAVAVAAVVALTAVNYGGVQKSARLTRVIVAAVLAVLAAVVTGCLTSAAADPDRLSAGLGEAGWSGLLQGAGLLFFAFAGYARITTLGEEVRDPQRTIRGPCRWRSVSPWRCTPRWRSRRCRCWAPADWPGPRPRWPTPYGRPGCRGWCRWCASVRRSPPSVRCSR